jgi:hypothetical protein
MEKIEPFLMGRFFLISLPEIESHCLTLQQAMLFVGCLVACLFVCYG